MTNKSEEISSFEVLNITFKDEVFSGCLGISKLQFLIKKAGSDSALKPMRTYTVLQNINNKDPASNAEQ